jgi:hypothetical protein
MPGTGTDTAFLEVARTFRPRILAERDRIEAARRLPEDLTRELASAGFSASSGLWRTRSDPDGGYGGFGGVGAGGCLGCVVCVER